MSTIKTTRHGNEPKTNNRITYVLVHGAWHGGWCWKRVRTNLQDAGHQVFTPTLTGLGERSHLNSAAVNLSTHITDVVNLLGWEDLSDVILCGHSYGGSVIHGITDRVSDRIRALVYLDAFVPEDGECLFDLHPPEHAMEMRRQAQVAGAGWKIPPIPAECFNVNQGDAAWVNAQCTFQSIASFEEPIRLTCTAPGVEDVTHILATGWENSVFPADHRRAKAKGWKTRTVACGHDVMLDLPTDLTDLLLEYAVSETADASLPKEYRTSCLEAKVILDC
jgi:pimeloyl-ACP methyl ester carboxylesterase